MEGEIKVPEDAAAAVSGTATDADPQRGQGSLQTRLAPGQADLRPGRVLAASSTPPRQGRARLL